MATNNEYWTKRFEMLQDTALAKGSKLYKELKKQYELAYKEIEKDIVQWYNRFVKDNNVTFLEAKKMLTEGELQEFKWSLDEYIKYASDNQTNELWAKQLQNASTRVHISRLDTLRIQIQNEMEKIYDTQLVGMTEVAQTIYEDNYYHTAYELQKGNNVAWKLKGLDAKAVEKVLATEWTDGSSFSDKIWNNKQKLIEKVTTGLSQNFIRGDSQNELIKTISKDFNVDLNKAGRLVMTESAFFSAEAQKDCFKDLGVEKYQVLGTLDSTTCSECGEYDSQVFDMKDYKEGVTAPPFHPWCRCTTIPYFEDEFEFGERAARDTDGNTYYVPRNISYKEWKEKYVDADPNIKSKFETQQKMNKNKSADFAQYKKYKETLGKQELGKSFAEFQEMKYNNISEWNNLKAQYSDAIGIKSEQQAKQYISNVNKTINEGKQNKHILGSNNYTSGKSYLTISTEEAQNLVNKYAGTGTLQFGDNGKWSKKEIITTDKQIGVVKNKTGEIKTNSFKIHYSKTGVHIVPYRKGGE